MPNLITPADLEKKQIAEKRVKDVFRVTDEAFTSKRRTHEYSNARFAAWAILKYEYNMSYNLIGNMYKKDHATVITGIKSAIVRLLPQMVGLNVYNKLRNKKSGKTVYNL